MKERKTKKNNGSFLVIGILLLFCIGFGYLLGSLAVSDDSGEKGFTGSFLLQMMLFFLAYYLQLILHEGGHLITGLLTGYRFSSFRIGGFMVLKNREGFSLKRFSLAGTGGQCLLIPPERKENGSYPYKLYHLGGVLINLLTAVLFFILFLVKRREGESGAFLLYLSVTGIITAVTNGLPLRIGGIATDGYNVIHIGKEPFALDAMWLQLKINEAQTEGIRLKDLPEEWFRIPESANKSNEIISAVAVFSENRAMDELDFRKAKEIIRTLLEDKEYSVIGLYKNLLLLDRVTIALIENGTDAACSEIETRQMKAFRKSMKNYPSVIRTEYAISLLKEKNPEAAEKYRERFRAVSETYPLKSDIASEGEIIRYLETWNESN